VATASAQTVSSSVPSVVSVVNESAAAQLTENLVAIDHAEAAEEAVIVMLINHAMKFVNEQISVGTAG
jgi:hypothetical protein